MNEEFSQYLTKEFESRKDSFLHSLSKSLSVIGKDQYMAQMFESQTSAVYIPNRVCEIISKQISCDREIYLNMLEKKLKALEQVFGNEFIQHFEELGNKIIHITKEHYNKDVIQREVIKSLRSQVSHFQEQYLDQHYETAKLFKTQTSNLYQSTLNAHDYVQLQIENFHKIILQAKDQINEKIFQEFISPKKEELKHSQDQLSELEEFHRLNVNLLKELGLNPNSTFEEICSTATHIKQQNIKLMNDLQNATRIISKIQKNIQENQKEIKELVEYKNIIHSISVLLKTTPENVEATVSSINDILSDECHQLGITNISKISPTIHELLKYIKLISKKQFNIDQYDEICRKHKLESSQELNTFLTDFKQQEQKIIQILQLKNENDVIPTIESIANRENQLLKILNLKESSNILNKVESLREEELSSMMNLGINDPTEINRKIIELKEKSERKSFLLNHICSLLNLKSEDDLINESSRLVKMQQKLSNSNKEAELILQKLRNIMQVQTNSSLEKSINEIVLSLNYIQRTIFSLLETSDIKIDSKAITLQKISDSFNKLSSIHIKQNKMIDEIKKHLNIDSVENIIQIISSNHQKLIELQNYNLSLNNTLQRIYHEIGIESFDQLEFRIKELILNLNTAETIFQKILFTLSGPEHDQIKLKFPLSIKIQNKIYTLLTAFKEKIEKNELEIKLILNKAKKMGFQGKELNDAITYIVNS